MQVVVFTKYYENLNFVGKRLNETKHNILKKANDY